MSSDEHFLAELLTALASLRLEALVVGSTAAVLQGAPVMTQDVDLLVRDTRCNREKVVALGAALGGQLVRASELANVLTVIGGAVPVDVILDGSPGGLSFEQLRARAVRVPVGSAQAVAISLEDVIRSKELTHRAKDLAQLPALRSTLEALRALQKL